MSLKSERRHLASAGHVQAYDLYQGQLRQREAEQEQRRREEEGRASLGNISLPDGQAKKSGHRRNISRAETDFMEPLDFQVHEMDLSGASGERVVDEQYTAFEKQVADHSLWNSEAFGAAYYHNEGDDGGGRNPEDDDDALLAELLQRAGERDHNAFELLHHLTVNSHSSGFNGQNETPDEHRRDGSQSKDFKWFPYDSKTVRVP